MRWTATMSSKGQLTVPLEVRKRLGLKQGDQVEFALESGLTVLRPAKDDTDPFAAYAGALGTFASTEEVDAWIAEMRHEGED